MHQMRLRGCIEIPPQNRKPTAFLLTFELALPRINHAPMRGSAN
jgi:hypothetical protein